MSIRKTSDTILLFDKNGSTLLFTYLSIFASLFLSALLIFAKNERIAVFAVWLMFAAYTIFMLCAGYYQVSTNLNKLSQTITISKKGLGRKLKTVNTIEFKEVKKVLYLWQLNDDTGGGRWSAILYLQVGTENERIKIYSQPSRKTYSHKDTVGPLETEGRSLAEFIGVDFETLDGLQPLDS